MKKAVFFTCSIIVNLMASGGYLARNYRLNSENSQHIREEAEMNQEFQEERGKVRKKQEEMKIEQKKRKSCEINPAVKKADERMLKEQVKEERERQYLNRIGIEVPSLAEIEENSYIYRYNHGLGQRKGLLNEDRLNNHYLNLQAVYRANLDACLMNVLDVEELDEKLADSRLGFVSRKAEEQNLYEKESTMGLAYIYQRNNLYIEYLSEEQLDLLGRTLESGRALITEEIKKMVKETFREVIRVRKPENWEDESRFLYPEAEGRKPRIPNQALVLGISNAMEYGASGKLLPDRYRKEKYECLDRIKKEKEKEYSEILGTEVYILIE